MPTIRKRGKRFQAQVRMSGFPTRTASFPTLRLAERWGTKIEADMIEGRHFRGVEARRRTLAEAIDRYLAEELPKKRNGSTHRSNLPWWKEHLGTLKLADITPAILVEYRGKLAQGTFIRANPKSARTTLKKGEEPRRFKRSPGTVNRYLAVLSHVFTVARKEWHWVSHNPFDGVGKLREGRGRVRFLSEDERTALLQETAKDRGRERRAPADRGRPRLQRGRRDLGHRRLRAHVRRAAPAGWEGRRPVRPQARPAARARRVRSRLPSQADSPRDRAASSPLAPRRASAPRRSHRPRWRC